jgi:hypothetical protein
MKKLTQRDVEELYTELENAFKTIDLCREKLTDAIRSFCGDESAEIEIEDCTCEILTVKRYIQGCGEESESIPVEWLLLPKEYRAMLKEEEEQKRRIEEERLEVRKREEKEKRDIREYARLKLKFERGNI